MVSHFIKRNIEIHSQSFSVRYVKAPHFLKLWHHHDELELVLVLEGEGTRFIGDSMEPFGPGDLVLLGDQLPHKWQNSQDYFEEQGLIAEGIIIHFEKDFLANALIKTSEFKNILRLIEDSGRGINFKGSVKLNAKNCILKILKTQPGLNRIILLLKLLGLLSEVNDFNYITSRGYVDSVYEKDVKLRKVNDHIMNNFQAPISLEDIANVACMNDAAFCRYFKKATNMNFSKYLNKIRIGYACKLLHSYDPESIARISYESGFNSLSNFNQKFKEFTGRTPTDYIKSVR